MALPFLGWAFFVALLWGLFEGINPMAPTFDTIRQQSDDRNLIRKIQKAIVLLRPVTPATPQALPSTLFTTGGQLVDFKADGWLAVGMVTTDGIEFGRDMTEEEVMALGYSGAVRTDVTEVARAVTFTPLETGRKHMLELTYGTDLTAVKQTLANGEIVFDEPDMPINQEYQLLILGSDGPALNNWILGRAYGAVKISSSDSQTWGQSDPVTTPITLKVLTDGVTGVPLRHFIGGTGAKAAKVNLGFAQGTV